MITNPLRADRRGSDIRFITRLSGRRRGPMERFCQKSISYLSQKLWVWM